MKRLMKDPVSMAVVVLVLAIPCAASGCHDSSSGGTASTGLKATFTASAAPADQAISLQAGGKGSTSDTFKVDVVVGAINYINGIDVRIRFDSSLVEYVDGSADFSATFLQGSLPATDLDTRASLFSTGTLDVSVARRGVAHEGIAMASGDAGALCTLTFKALAATAGTAMAIDGTDYLITVCPTVGGSCTTICPDAAACDNAITVTVSGGTVTAS
jgi:hypothetical protein